MERPTRRRRIALAAASLLMFPVLNIASASSPVRASDPQLWPVSWDLNKTHDVEELSRLFDRDEDGYIDAVGEPATQLESMLNASEFSLHADGCAAPPGFVSFDWTLSRVDSGEVLATESTVDCVIDLALPDRPYPEAREYDLSVVAHYPATPDQVVLSRVRVRDVFMVGLGDSYGSGEGNPLDPWHFGDPHAEWDNNRCHRSRLSGQEQAARMIDSIPGINVTFLHLACSGAKAAEGILAPYEGLIVDEGRAPLPSQIEQAAAYVALSAFDRAARRYPDIVVTSIGGNDAGFSDVVKACLLPPWVPVPIPAFPYVAPIDVDECHEPGAAGDEIFRPGLDTIAGLYADIGRAVNGTHPTLPALCHPVTGCEFLITEYPDGATDENGDTCSYGGFTEDEFQWVIDEMVTDLNTKIRETAQSLGWTYVHGVRAAFDRHGICAGDDWFRDIFESFEIQKDQNGAFHPDSAGHYFGYAPAITQAARTALGVPYPWSLSAPPMYVGTGSPDVCDSVVGDGNLESFTPAPATDVSTLDLPPEVVSGLANGSIPFGMAGSVTCAANAGIEIPFGQVPMELRTGRPGCPDDPRPCAGSSAGSSLLRLPVFGDPLPAIDARATSDVARSAGDVGTERHRTGSANAQGKTVFFAAPFNGSDTVSGEFVVDLTAFAQAGGADASGIAEFDVGVRAVTADSSDDIASLQLRVERTSCEEDAEFVHGCAQFYGRQRARLDTFSLRARSGDEMIVDISDETNEASGGAAGSALAVSNGLRSPSRSVRLPYSVPAGAVIEITVSAGAYASNHQLCTNDENGLPCSAQARMGGRVTFAPDVSTGTLFPLSGFTHEPVDRIPPNVTATPGGTVGTNGWYTGAANVHLAAVDDGDGVESISYRVDGGPTIVVDGASATVPLPTNGTHVVVFTAVDRAGNVSDAQSVVVRVDATAPTVTVSLEDGGQYPAGAVVPTGLQCADLLSGISTCTGPAQLDTTVPGTHTAAFTATDLAGNVATTTLGYTIVPASPPDRITLSIKELDFKVAGEVESGGFTIARSPSGDPKSVHGTAVVITATGSQATITVDAVNGAKGWIGSTTVHDPETGVEVTATVEGKNAVRAVGTDAVTGKASSKEPKFSVAWTITDVA